MMLVMMMLAMSLKSKQLANFNIYVKFGIVLKDELEVFRLKEAIRENNIFLFQDSKELAYSLSWY